MNNLSKTLVLCSALMLTACAEDDPQKFIEEGKVLFEKGELKSARVQFKSALQHNPQLAEPYYHIALLDEEEQKWSAMRTNLQEVVRLDPNHLDGHVKLGFLLIQQTEKAKEQLDFALKLDSNNFQAILLDAAIKYHEGDNVGARKQVERVLAVDKGDSQAVRMLVRVLTDEKLYDDAMIVLNPGIENNPDDLGLRLLEVSILTKQDREDKQDRLIEVYEKLIADFPDDKSLRRTQIATLAGFKKSKMLEKALEEAISKDPSDIDHKMALVGHYELVKKDQVEVLLQGFIDNAPAEARFKFRLAGIYTKDKQYQKARELFKQIIDADPNGKNGMRAKVHLIKIALDQKDQQLTERLVSEILDTDKRNNEALLIRANMRLDKKDADGAISDLRIVLRDKPNSDEGLVLMARASVMNGEFEVAESYWKKAIDANPANLTAIVPLVATLSKRGDIERAEELVVKSIKASPLNSALVEVLVKFRIAKKDWSGAEGAVNELRKKNNGEISALMLDGLIADKRGRYLDAIKVYKQVLDKEPKSNGALVAISRAYSQLKRKAEFMNFLQVFIKKNPRSIIAFNMLGQLYAIEKNWVEATKVLQESLDIDRQFISTYELLAAVHTQQGENFKVIDLYNEGLIALPNNRKLMMGLARGYESLKDYEKAISAYEKMVSQFPDDEQVANNLAFLLIEYRSGPEFTEKALSLLERFKKSANPYLQDTFGWALFKSGQFERSIEVLRNSVSIMPDDTDIHYHLGEALYAVGNYSASKLELEKSLALVERRGKFTGIKRARFLLKEINSSPRS